jgi:hypothetical protein
MMAGLGERVLLVRHNRQTVVSGAAGRLFERRGRDVSRAGLQLASDRQVRIMHQRKLTDYAACVQ